MGAFGVCALAAAACGAGVVASWADAGLTVAFVTGDEVLAAWTVASSPDWYPGQVVIPAGIGLTQVPARPLATAEGVGLGSPVSALSEAYPSAEYLAWNDSTFVPTGFYVPSSGVGDEELAGDLDWPSVMDVQVALNAAGADLVVDGIAGPRTQDALTTYLDTHQVEAPESFPLLGLDVPPPTATVARLSAGGWWWELGCGALEPAGLTSRC